MDQKGIHPNTAFTSYTYEEYAALKKAPPPSELLERVIADDFKDCRQLHP